MITDPEALREWAYWESLDAERRAENTEGVPPYNETEVAWLIQGMIGPVTKASTVLDLGCGTGRLSCPFHRISRCELHCVDISASMLSMVGGVKANIRTHLCDGRTIPDSVPQLDAAYSVTMFQHIPHSAQISYLRQVADRLRPGGRFAFTLAIGAHSEPPSFLNHKVSWSSPYEWIKTAGLTAVDEFADSRGWWWFVTVKP